MYIKYVFHKTSMLPSYYRPPFFFLDIPHALHCQHFTRLLATRSVALPLATFFGHHEWSYIEVWMWQFNDLFMKCKTCSICILTFISRVAFVKMTWIMNYYLNTQFKWWAYILYIHYYLISAYSIVIIC